MWYTPLPAEGGYKFSLDPILLTGFTRFGRRTHYLVDLGAGSGIVGIILAKRYPWTETTLVEVQNTLVRLSAMNIKLNNLQGRIKPVAADIASVHRGPYRDLPHGAFDAVVTNPPYRKPGTGKISPRLERAIARHEINLTLGALLQAVVYLLKNRGRLFMVYHTNRFSELVDSMKRCALEPKRMRFVHAHGHTDASMVLVEAVKGGGVELRIEPPLIVFGDDGQYSDEVQSFFSGSSP